MLPVGSVGLRGLRFGFRGCRGFRACVVGLRGLGIRASGFKGCTALVPCWGHVNNDHVNPDQVFIRLGPGRSGFPLFPPRKVSSRAGGGGGGGSV